AGRGASGPGRLALLRAEAGPGAPLLHRELQRLPRPRTAVRVQVTRLVALIGHPVAHSRSPQMQNAAFLECALDWAYLALDVPPGQVAEAVRGLVGQDFAGANVTIPHKREAAAACDEAEGDAVNTLVFRDGRVLGFNTDKEIVARIDSTRVCLIGAGGAAA